MPREVPGFKTAGEALRMAAPQVAGDWYCRACGYLSSSRVTNAETCDTCHQPVEWHTVEQQTALELAQQALGACAGLADELRQIRDRYLMATPDKTTTPWGVLTRAIEAAEGARKVLGAPAEQGAS